MSPVPTVEANEESMAVRLQLRITSSPGVGLDVDADKVTINEAIGSTKEGTE